MQRNFLSVFVVCVCVYETVQALVYEPLALLFPANRVRV